MERIPVLKIGTLLLVTIQIDMNDRMAITLQDDLTKRIVKDRAKGVLIDICALDLVDSFTGRIISDIAAMAKILDADTVLVGRAEVQEPGVFQELAEDRAHRDVLAQAGLAGAQRADPADHDVHRYAGLRGPVAGVDDRLVHQRVRLEPDPGPGLAGAVRLDLVVDPADDAAADPVGGDEQAPVRGLARVAGERVEQVGEVGADRRVGGEHADVLVEPRRLRVVVAGADVAVAADRVALLAHHEAGLAVRLEADQAVDDVHARALQLTRPADVRLLVEPRLDLHQRDDLLARRRGVLECVDDGGVAGRPVQRLLDRQHVLVCRGLLDEALHAGGERVVRVVHQDVTLAQCREHALGGLAFGELRATLGKIGA